MIARHTLRLICGSNATKVEELTDPSLEVVSTYWSQHAKREGT